MLVALVAEDEVLVRLALCEYLRGAGFQVLEAANADEARVILAAADDIDVLISDINMGRPGEGIELALWAASHNPSVPVILTSGNISPAQSAAIAACRNVTDVVPKPYFEKSLERLIRARIAARHSSPK